MPFILERQTFSDPKYIFFLKRINYPRNPRGHLDISNHDKQKLSTSFKTFKLNKLKDSTIPI